MSSTKQIILVLASGLPYIFSPFFFFFNVLFIFLFCIPIMPHVDKVKAEKQKRKIKVKGLLRYMINRSLLLIKPKSLLFYTSSSTIAETNCMVKGALKESVMFGSCVEFLMPLRGRLVGSSFGFIRFEGFVCIVVSFR